MHDVECSIIIDGVPHGPETYRAGFIGYDLELNEVEAITYRASKGIKDRFVRYEKTPHKLMVELEFYSYEEMLWFIQSYGEIQYVFSDSTLTYECILESHAYEAITQNSYHASLTYAANIFGREMNISLADSAVIEVESPRATPINMVVTLLQDADESLITVDDVEIKVTGTNGDIITIDSENYLITKNDVSYYNYVDLNKFVYLKGEHLFEFDSSYMTVDLNYRSYL